MAVDVARATNLTGKAQSPDFWPDRLRGDRGEVCFLEKPVDPVRVGVDERDGVFDARYST